MKQLHHNYLLKTTLGIINEKGKSVYSVIFSIFKKWGDRGLDYTNVSSEKLSTLNINTRKRKLREKEGEFFVKKLGVTVSYIHFTQQYVEKNNSYCGSVSKEQPSKLLLLLQIINKSSYSFVELYIDRSTNIIESTIYQKFSQYYWLNRSQSENKPALFLI